MFATNAAVPVDGKQYVPSVENGAVIVKEKLAFRVTGTELSTAPGQRPDGPNQGSKKLTDGAQHGVHVSVEVVVPPLEPEALPDGESDIADGLV